MKKIIGGSLILMGILLAGCGTSSIELSQEEITTPTPTAKIAEGTSLLDIVAPHNTQEDCRTVIENNVYNVTDFIDQHPGGEKILQACGIDGTELFSKHPENARETLKNYIVAF